MTDSKIIDSSIWIGYLFEGKFIDEIETDVIFSLSALSLFEIKTKLLRKNVSKEDIKAKMEFIKKRSIIIPITEELAERASEISFEKKLPMADSLIYTTAVLNELTLVTADNDFRKLENAIVLS